jgi:methyl-accepting chemotaxis protein
MLSSFIGIGLFVLAWRMISSVSHSISTTIDGLTHLAIESSDIAENMEHSSQQLSSGATQAASSLEETAASLEELSSVVSKNAERARQAASASKSSAVSAETGQTEITRLIQQMSEIAQASKQIETIIGLIEDIAFQTNLLALNAAVEAARAGEQGRGFAVVAEAVRSLAQRSSVAAQDITSLVRSTVTKVEAGAQAASKSRESLTEIVHSVANMASLNGEIASASEEQATGVAQISKAVNQLDQATQSNAAEAERSSHHSQLARQQAIDLQNHVLVLHQSISGLSSDSKRHPVHSLPDRMNIPNRRKTAA